MTTAGNMLMLSGGKNGWTNPYIINGLVAMWDGEWNAGGGIHDSTATTWVDLSGSGHDIPLTGGSFGDNYLSVSGLAGSTSAITGDIMTIEYVGISTKKSIVQGVMQIQKSGGYYTRHIVYRANNTLNFGASGPCFVVDPTVRLYAAEAFASASGVDGTLYKNGLITSSQGAGAYVSGSNTEMKVGNVGGYTFYGEINRIAIYSRGLTAAEIAANYAVDKARFGLP